MCNFYIMYYTTNDGIQLADTSCWGPPPSWLHFPSNLPPLPTAATPTDEEEVDGAHSHNTDMEDHHPHPSSLITLPPSLPPETTPPLPPPRELPSPGELPPSREVTPPRELPPPATTVVPPAPDDLVQAEDWPLNGFPIPTQTLGQITAVAIDGAGDVHILHRGPVTWDLE